MMTKTRILLLLLILAAILAACSGRLTSNNLENNVELEPNGSDEKGGDLTGPVIVYERSGGMMGALETWKIYADGTLYAVHSDTEWQSDPAAVDALLTTAETAHFNTLSASYMPTDACCDRYTYTITLNTADQPHTVTTMEEADAPGDLFTLIDALEQYIRETTA